MANHNEKAAEDIFPTEVIAEHIVKISEAMSRIKAGRLKEHTVIILLQDITKLSQRDIKKVLDALQVMSNVYVKAKPDLKKMMENRRG